MSKRHQPPREGGRYIIEDGKRRLVDRTANPQRQTSSTPHGDGKRIRTEKSRKEG